MGTTGIRILFDLERKGWIMSRKTDVNIDINVTKIVKYVCIAGIVIVAVIFIEKAFKEFVKSPSCIKKCTD